MQSEATTMTNCQVNRFPGIQVGEEEDEGQEESVQKRKKGLQYNKMNILIWIRHFVSDLSHDSHPCGTLS